MLTFCLAEFRHLAFICLNKNFKMLSLCHPHIASLLPGNQHTLKGGILKEGSFTLHHLLRGGGQRFAKVGEEHLKGTEIADRMVPQEPYRSAQPGAEYYPQGRLLRFYC